MAESNRNSDTITALQRELRELRRIVTRLTKAAATSATARRATPAPITCSSLTVVNAQGRVVASIDGSGRLQCASGWIASGTSGTGVLLDGAFGWVKANQLAATDETGEEIITMTGLGGNGLLEMHGKREQSSVRLQAYRGQGGVLSVMDSTRKNEVQILAARDQISLTLRDGTRGRGEVSAFAGTVSGGDGVLSTVNHLGAPTSRLGAFVMQPRVVKKAAKRGR